MGNQGTTNWKLTAFFAISLMLIAGLFSNAAIAGNGDGTITVGWTGEVTDDVGRIDDIPTDSRDSVGDGSNVVSASLAAGSRGNSLKFTYTVPLTISMAGGELEIDIPTGWTILPKVEVPTTLFEEAGLFDNVVITVDGETIYNSTADSVDDDNTVTPSVAGTLAITDVHKASHANVTIGDPIKVTFGSGWSNGGTLVIALGNVETAIPSRLREGSGASAYTAYTFQARSKASGGAFVRLKPFTNTNPQPRVRVGNILGTRTVDADGVLGDTANEATANDDADITKRIVAVTPATSYPGEKHNYQVVFTAPGPMYGTLLRITIPEELTPPAGKTNAQQISVRASGVLHSFNAGVTTALAADTPLYGLDTDERIATIHLMRIDEGQKVTLTFREATVGVVNTATAVDMSEFVVNTRIPAADDNELVTKITGGAFALAPGSGKVAVSPDNARVNARISRLTLTYTADAAIDGYTLVFTVPQEFMATRSTGTLEAVEGTGDADNPQFPAEDSFYLGLVSGKDGYIQSPDSGGAVPSLAVPARNATTGAIDKGTIETALGNTFEGVAGFAAANVGAVITWSGVKLAKDATFRTYIDRVTVAESGAALTFFGAAAPDAATDAVTFTAADAHANFYIVDPENDGVRFAANASSLPAASLQEITFTFKAETTPIKDGTVQFSIPSGWTTPVKKDADGTDVLGQTALTAGGDHDKDLTVSSRSITVKVKSLAINSSVTVVYGSSDKKAKVQNRATALDKPLKINGYYWASSGSPRRGAGTVDIEITNAEDGTGTATIRPTTAKAGSIDTTFTIEYKPVGTMDGGTVSLQLPTDSDWGMMQTDPTKLNYVRVTSSGGASVAEVDNGGSIVIVTLDKCPPTGTIRFIYGGGTGARRGATVQDDTGVAIFKIESSGDEFGTLVAVTGTEAKATVTTDDPKYLGETFTDAAGQLRVDVTGASDGTGTATVELVASKAGDDAYTDERGNDVTEMRVHAADDATYIKLVYTPTQTIEDGTLRFTAPRGWSKPQGSDPGSPGFTLIQGGGGASIDAAGFADGDANLYVDVPIRLIDTSGSIEIHYGETAGSGGGAVAPAASGKYRFMIDVKGGDADTNAFRAIRGTVDGDNLEIKVYSQASGGGSAAVTAGDDGITAGGSAAVTVVYTAAGDINNGMLKLMTPANWSHPLMSNVAITYNGQYRFRECYGLRRLLCRRSG